MDIFKKSYSGEELADLSRDIDEALDERFTPICNQIPTDECGFPTGTFTIHITWDADEDD